MMTHVQPPLVTQCASICNHIMWLQNASTFLMQPRSNVINSNRSHHNVQPGIQKKEGLETTAHALCKRPDIRWSTPRYDFALVNIFVMTHSGCISTVSSSPIHYNHSGAGRYSREVSLYHWKALSPLSLLCFHFLLSLAWITLCQLFSVPAVKSKQQKTLLDFVIMYLSAT